MSLVSQPHESRPTSKKQVNADKGPKNRHDLELDPVVLGFSNRLDEIGLKGLLRLYAPSGVRADALAHDRPQLSINLGYAVDLLCLSRPVPHDIAASILSTPMLSHLSNLGIASVVDGFVTLAEARIVDHLGQLVFVGREGNSEFGYYGPPSVSLGRLLVGARGRCLDLFASTGCQALIMSTTAAEVTAVERDRNLDRLFNINLLLNGAYEKVNIKWTNTRDESFDEEFDTVSIHPPMMPTFGVLDLPWTANGGVDGADLLQNSMQRINLAPSGQIVATAMVAGNESLLDLGWLRDLTESHGWQTLIIPTGYARLTSESTFIRRSVEHLCGMKGQELTSMMRTLAYTWADKRYSRLYYCLIDARRSQRYSFTIASTSLMGPGWIL